MRLRVGMLAGVAVGVLFLLGSAGTAGANAVTTGDCHGSGHWQGSGQEETSQSHNPSDVITIPLADVVDWEGALGANQLGSVVPQREIEGKVEAKLPAGWVTIDDWGGSSVRAANAGTHSYDLPSVLIGVKIKLHGVHRDNGVITCEGSGYVKVAGSAFKNPLAFVGLGGMVIFGGVFLYAGKAVFTKVAPAFEDINPG